MIRSTTAVHYGIPPKQDRSGMGGVYPATDAKLDREVAINDLATETGHRVRRADRQVLDCASPRALLICQARPIAAEDDRTPGRYRANPPLSSQ